MTGKSVRDIRASANMYSAKLLNLSVHEFGLNLKIEEIEELIQLISDFYQKIEILTNKEKPEANRQYRYEIKQIENFLSNKENQEGKSAAQLMLEYAAMSEKSIDNDSNNTGHQESKKKNV